MNWPHAHLALNHLPVLGSIFLFLLLLVAVYRHSDELKRIALQGSLLLTVVSIPIKFTGDFAHEALPKGSEIEVRLINHHEETADQATTGIFITGAIAFAGLFAARKQKPIPRWAINAAIVATLVTVALMLRTAGSGGVIRHPEIRSGTP